MKLYNISFSPTGTSAKVATAIIHGIMANIDCRTITLDATHQSVTCEPISKDDLAIISAPVYGGKMASLAKERMKTLTADGTPCILVAVYGNRAFENALNDMSFLQARSALSRQELPPLSANTPTPLPRHLSPWGARTTAILSMQRHSDWKSPGKSH